MKKTHTHQISMDESMCAAASKSPGAPYCACVVMPSPSMHSAVTSFSRLRRGCFPP